MSANNKSFNEVLTCKICQKYYLNPILLPCRNNICEEHINKQTKDINAQSYKCELCSQDHEIPENGFIVNEPFIEMMNTNVHLDEITIAAKRLVDHLENSNKKIDLIEKDPEDFIYSYFSNEKNKVDLKRETLFAKINDISDEMINKIKQMENDCKSNLSEKQKNLIDKNKFDSEKVTKKISVWKEEMRNPKLDKTQLAKIVDESINLLSENANQSFEAKNKILNKIGCFFSSNDNKEFKRELFGELIIEEFTKTNRREKYNSPLIALDSNIVNSDQSVELIKLCEFKALSTFKLLYRASRDGFSSKVFHSKCDKKPKTLTLIKVKDKPHIFGGYTEATWEGDSLFGKSKQDPNAFIFSLVNYDHKPIKMKIYQLFQDAIYCHSGSGPTFGGNDFIIDSNSNNNKESFSELGDTYKHPKYQYGSSKARNFLAGSFRFSTSEIEVFQVI
jgi:hypothetical protein